MKQRKLQRAIILLKELMALAFATELRSSTARLARSLYRRWTHGFAGYILSDLASGVTGDIHHVEGGYNAIGMKQEDAPDIALV